MLLFEKSAIGFNTTASAQKAINSVHFYDVKNADMEKTYIASLKEINTIMAEIGFPKNYYSYFKLAASDTTKTYRNCTIGHILGMHHHGKNLFEKMRRMRVLLCITVRMMHTV
jgi:hypothetical protein